MSIDQTFYYSKDRIFKNKIEALLYKKNTNSEVYFNYYDNIYNSIDWKTEPPQSLEYYYKEQAQRIRDSYDYIILFYSGGYDSMNILETFYYNNIKIDKIVMVGAFSQDSSSGVDENHNGELYHNAFPYLKTLGLDNITQICDYTTMFSSVKNFNIQKFGENWIDEIGPWYSPHNWFWYEIEEHVIPSDIGNKKVGMIFGRDKPSIFYENNRPGFMFRDTPILSYGGNRMTSAADRINFYWDPSYTNILLKQLHVMLSSGLTNPDKVVYNLKNTPIFKSGKSPTNLLSLRDKYLLNNTNSEVFEFWKLGMKNIQRQVDLKDVKPLFSKFYTLT
jgi:hypothetical protein